MGFKVDTFGVSVSLLRLLPRCLRHPIRFNYTISIYTTWRFYLWRSTADISSWLIGSFTAMPNNWDDLGCNRTCVWLFGVRKLPTGYSCLKHTLIEIDFTIGCLENLSLMHYSRVIPMGGICPNALRRCRLKGIYNCIRITVESGVPRRQWSHTRLRPLHNIFYRI